jgi:hypothetical protein
MPTERSTSQQQKIDDMKQAEQADWARIRAEQQRAAAEAERQYAEQAKEKPKER